MTATFVWMPGNRGPVPQIWHVAMKREKEDLQPLAVHELKDGESALSFDELVKLYPAPTP